MKFEVRIVLKSGNVETMMTGDDTWTINEVLAAATKEVARRNYRPNAVIGVHITLPIED